jgi:hypothetical protein
MRNIIFNMELYLRHAYFDMTRIDTPLGRHSLSTATRIRFEHSYILYLPRDETIYIVYQMSTRFSAGLNWRILGNVKGLMKINHVASHFIGPMRIRSNELQRALLCNILPPALRPGQEESLNGRKAINLVAWIKVGLFLQGRQG